MTWLQTLMKDVTSYIMLQGSARSLWSEDIWMRFRYESVRMSNAGNWNVLVPAGKEINWDAVSKGDWTQQKANWILCWKAKEMWCCKTACINLISGTWSYLERYALKCDSHVGLTEKILAVSWVLFTGYWIGNWEASISNLKYTLSPIANSTVMERWKVPMTGSKKNLKPNSVVRYCSTELYHTFRITCQGVHLSGKGNSSKEVP